VYHGTQCSNYFVCTRCDQIVSCNSIFGGWSTTHHPLLPSRVYLWWFATDWCRKLNQHESLQGDGCRWEPSMFIHVLLPPFSRSYPGSIQAGGRVFARSSCLTSNKTVESINRMCRAWLYAPWTWTGAVGRVFGSGVLQDPDINGLT